MTRSKLLVTIRQIEWSRSLEYAALAHGCWLDVWHLLDGDLASNHLSWQWVAGTGSHKPYLFNAENVGRYAPLAWHSAGSVIDAAKKRTS